MRVAALDSFGNYAAQMRIWEEAFHEIESGVYLDPVVKGLLPGSRHYYPSIW